MRRLDDQWRGRAVRTPGRELGCASAGAQAPVASAGRGAGRAARADQRSDRGGRRRAALRGARARRSGTDRRALQQRAGARARAAALRAARRLGLPRRAAGGVRRPPRLALLRRAARRGRERAPAVRERDRAAPRACHVQPGARVASCAGCARGAGSDRGCCSRPRASTSARARPPRVRISRDRYYRLEAGYAYAFYQRIEEISLTLVRVRGEGGATIGDTSELLDPGIDFGRASVTLFAFDLLRLRSALLLGASQQGFEWGGSGEMRDRRSALRAHADRRREPDHARVDRLPQPRLQRERRDPHGRTGRADRLPSRQRRRGAAPLRGRLSLHADHRGRSCARAIKAARASSAAPRSASRCATGSSDHLPSSAWRTRRRSSSGS